MLARPEQTEARVDSQAERRERRFSDLVDTCSRLSRDIVRADGWNRGSTAGTAAITAGRYSSVNRSNTVNRRIRPDLALRRTTRSVPLNEALSRKRGGWVDVSERAGRSLRELSARGPKSHP